MYPRQHALVSGIAAGLSALTLQLPPSQLLLWTLIGAVAGVVIDVDHALLSMLLRGRTEKGLYWFRHPVAAITEPDKFLEDMDYDVLVYHRLVSHVVVLLVLVLLLPVHTLVVPAVIGLAAHIAGDVFWDLRTGNY